MILWQVFNRHGSVFMVQAVAAEEAIEAARPLFAANWIVGPDYEAVPDPAFVFEGVRAIPVTTGDVRDGEPARYGAARARLATTLRESQALFAEEHGEVWDWRNELNGVLAEMLERPSPFAAMAGRQAAVVSSAGCYEASFGMVHVRPGCRCGGRR